MGLKVDQQNQGMYIRILRGEQIRLSVSTADEALVPQKDKTTIILYSTTNLGFKLGEGEGSTVLEKSCDIVSTVYFQSKIEKPLFSMTLRITYGLNIHQKN